ncbi:hypothetical protein BaRGS_00005949 [Batillaria attramentaria]|uniref:Arginase n=1 Tax=Batillaria attramentaria TaxID=370345 RepID=A0ABD0LSY7_9CAEN
MESKKKPQVGVVGIPFSLGQVTDYGDLNLEAVADDKPWNKVKNPRSVGLANKKVAEMVAKITKNRQIALTLGGDHSVAIGSIYGHAQSCPNLVVVWVDAHADLNTPLSSPSGNIHGMPLSFVIKEMKKYTTALPGFEWVQPCLSAKDLVFIGLRDVDEAERAFINELGIQCYSMQEVDKYGIQNVMERALRTIDPNGVRPIHLSFDVDALDPAYAPATGTPVHGGLTRREAYYIAEEIAGTGRLSCLDTVEVNPLLSTDEGRQVTINSTVDVVSHFFGKRREGNVSDGYRVPTPP